MTELFIQKNDNKTNIALVENGKLIEYYLEDENLKGKEGNIYIGIVKDIIKGMQAAFVDIGTEKNSFIHLKDILKKVDETKEEKENLDNLDISKEIKKGQKLLVQIKKDSNIQKGARVSTHINLPGKYIVLLPNTDIITVSSKIEDKKEQERLKELVRKNLSANNGAIVRTSAEGKTKEIIKDIKYVEEKWENILNTGVKENSNSPELIYESEDIVQKMLLDLSDQKINKIIINDEKRYKELKKMFSNNEKYKNIEVELVKKSEILDKYDMKNQIEKMQNRKIWLKCGGFITIDKTEALTAIDVNTGKYTGNKNAEDTIFKVNKEATLEIAKQIRLRDIGGIIIIDYIDMNNENDKKKIQDLLTEELKKDRSKTQVEGFTKLDLMEITRKHICSHYAQ